MNSNHRCLHMSGPTSSTTPEPSDKLKALVEGLTLHQQSAPKDDYAFWKTQPVAQFNEDSPVSQH